MAPTQVLARQHQAYFESFTQAFGFHPVLLTGGLKKSERMQIYTEISSGRFNVVIGTQALLQEGVVFKNLGLIVIDEQHRFGVRQRLQLNQKGVNPHLLIMTATPIPRTLGMTLFADLDISTIKQYPRGRWPVITRIVDDSGKRIVFNEVRQRLQAGQQAMVVCPVIEGSEETDLKNVSEMFARLEEIFSPRFRVGLIHGRLSPAEKDQVMESFRKGCIHLLVGTTVVEVGVHAPGATVMVVEHAERFGLAQLHQLRGRVGRGSVRGLCFLMASKGLSRPSLERLKILANSNDGFEIAEKDLQMRGQGELMGAKQAGVGELDLNEFLQETKLLVAAKKEADRLVSADPHFSKNENRLLRALIDTGSERGLAL
jgi:ATP-dependent DNA helicase RecG